MIVFKNYLRLLRGAIPSIIIFLIITLVITTLSTGSKVQPTGFTLAKPKITIINKDNGELANGLVSYLSEKTNVIEFKEDEIKDALFFYQIECAVIINDDFFNKGITIEKAQDISGALQTEILINKYLNLANLYLESDVENFVDLLEKDLENEVVTNFEIEEIQVNAVSDMRFYFNFISYSLIATIIASVALIMRAYNEQNIKMRSMCSPVSFKKYNGQIIMGNIVVSFIFWIAFMLLGYFVYGKTLFTDAGLLMILNAFIFAQVALAIAYAIGTFVKNNEVQNGLAQVIALGSSFLGGAFVPQFALGSIVLLVARITPTYWYARNNDLLVDTNKITNEYLFNLFALVLFATIIYLISLYLKNRHAKYIN